MYMYIQPRASDFYILTMQQIKLVEFGKNKIYDFSYKKVVEQKLFVLRIEMLRYTVSVC